MPQENLYKLLKEPPSPHLMVPCLGGSAPPFCSSGQSCPVFSAWLFANEQSHHPLSWQIQALVQTASGLCCPATLPSFPFMSGRPRVTELETGLPPALWACARRLHLCRGPQNSSQRFLRNGFEIQSGSQVCLEWRSTSSILEKIWI